MNLNSLLSHTHFLCIRSGLSACLGATGEEADSSERATDRKLQLVNDVAKVKKAFQKQKPSGLGSISIKGQYMTVTPVANPLNHFQKEVHTKTMQMPSPCEFAKFRINDVLDPSDRLLIEFTGIYDANYIGINFLHLYDAQQNEVRYQILKLDGKKLGKEEAKNMRDRLTIKTGWWNPGGERHSMLIGFWQDRVRPVAHVRIRCCLNASLKL